MEYFIGCFLMQGLLYEHRWHCFNFAPLHLEGREGICMRNNLPFHNSKEVILSHLCPSTVQESLCCYFWNVLLFCVRDLLFAWTFFSLTAFPSSLTLLRSVLWSYMQFYTSLDLIFLQLFLIVSFQFHTTTHLFLLNHFFAAGCDVHSSVCSTIIIFLVSTGWLHGELTV